MAPEFPIHGSLIDPNANEDTMVALFSQLEKRKKALFSEDETDTAMHFWESNSQPIGL